MDMSACLTNFVGADRSTTPPQTAWNQQNYDESVQNISAEINAIAISLCSKGTLSADGQKTVNKPYTPACYPQSTYYINNKVRQQNTAPVPLQQMSSRIHTFSIILL